VLARIDAVAPSERRGDSCPRVWATSTAAPAMESW
jgi:hypothetical protein